MITKVCERCGVEFEYKPKAGPRRKYCTPCARGIRVYDKITIECEQCGKSFEWRVCHGGSRKRFCDDCGRERDKSSSRKHSRLAYHKKGGRYVRYGLTEEEFKSLHEVQGGACAVCRRISKRLCIDHCHETGRIRGLLCYSCNSGLGQLGDDPELLERGVAYLRGERFVD